MVGSAAIVTTDTNSSPSIIRVENQSHPPPECSSQNPNYPAAELPSVDSPTPRLPTVRIASEFDSDVSTFFNKVSWRVLNGLAKLKVQFKSTPNGEINNPQISFMTKYLSLLYDFDDQDTLLTASFNPGGMLQVKGVHDVRRVQLGETKYFHIGCSTKFFSLSCVNNDNESVISFNDTGSNFQFKYHHSKSGQGEVKLVAAMPDPSYKLDFGSALPFDGSPKAGLTFPHGEIRLEGKESEVGRVLSLGGILRGNVLNGVGTARFKDDDLNLRYSYKDEEVTFIPSLCLPSNVLSFAFKRRFGPSDKLSYMYNFNSSYWNAVYKYTFGKEFKVKAGYDSEVRLAWTSLWIGKEDGGAKTAPMKVKIQFMLQVPQDNIHDSRLLFRVKKRWDL